MQTNKNDLIKYGIKCAATVAIAYIFFGSPKRYSEAPSDK
jgi:hypothetical protein